MAAGDIIGVTILSDGWRAEVNIDGLSTGGTYNFGAYDTAIANAKVVFTVVSEGYNTSGVLGTITRTVYGLCPDVKVYPNQAQNNERSNGAGGVIVTVVLSDGIFDDDKNGGAGTSGTNPTVTIASGFYTQAATPTNSTTALACTNNSTLDYPKAIGYWATVPYQKITASTFDIEACVFHMFGQNGNPVACVKFGDGVTADQYSTAMVKSSQADALPVYRRTLTLSSYVDNTVVTCDFTAYPWVGDANSVVASSGTAGVQALGSLPFLCDPDNDYNTFVAVVDPVSGNNGTGVASTTYATAAASPFLTARNAMAAIATANGGDAGGGTVYLKSGNHTDWGSGSVAAANAWVTVTRDTGVSKANAKIVSDNTGGLGQYTGAEKLRLYDLTIVPTASSYIGGSSTSYRMWLDNVDITPVAQRTNQIAGEFGYVWATHCTSTLMNKPAWCDNGINHLPVIVRGCTVTNCTHGVTVSAGQGPSAILSSSFTMNATNTRLSTIDRANSIIAYTKVYKSDTTGSVVSASSAFGQAAIVCCIFEQITNDTAVLSLWSDGNTNACNDILLWHVTLAGRRANLFYNDTVNVSTARRNLAVRHCAMQRIATKHDQFAGPTSGGTGLEIGARSFAFQVNCRGNHMEDSITDSVQLPYFTNGTTLYLMGRGSTRNAAAGFTSDLSYTSSGTGGGDYRPTSGSTLRSKIGSSSEILIPFDIAGNAYVNTAGAFEFQSVAPAPTPLYYRRRR